MPSCPTQLTSFHTTTYTSSPSTRPAVRVIEKRCTMGSDTCLLSGWAGGSSAIKQLNVFQSFVKIVSTVSSNIKRTMRSMIVVKHVTLNLNSCGLLLFLHKLKGKMKSATRSACILTLFLDYFVSMGVKLK